MSQGLLFDIEEKQDDYNLFSAKVKRCGKCAGMDVAKPGCHNGLGRCVFPGTRAYWLSPENTRINECYEIGDPGREPDGGSWSYVASDSVACAAFKARKP